MSRAFTAASFQAALATAILTVAPLAGAAIAARQVYTHTDQQNEPQPAVAQSTLTRAQVRSAPVTC